MSAAIDYVNLHDNIDYDVLKTFEYEDPKATDDSGMTVADILDNRNLYIPPYWGKPNPNIRSYKKDIKNIFDFIYQKDNHVYKTFTATGTCPICLEDYTDGKFVKYAPGHEHSDYVCVQCGLNVKQYRCPICGLPNWIEMTDEAKEVFPHGISQHDGVILEFMNNIK